jgi:hypothetical protein
MDEETIKAHMGAFDQGICAAKSFLNPSRQSETVSL